MMILRSPLISMNFDEDDVDSDLMECKNRLSVCLPWFDFGWLVF